MLAHPHRPALAKALADIDEAFGWAAYHRDFKNRVRHIIRRGPSSEAVQVRYRGRFRSLAATSLDNAISLIERDYRLELAGFTTASAFGRGSRLPLMVLEELRLIFRWLRFKKKHRLFGIIASEILGYEPVGQWDGAATMQAAE